MKLQAKCTTISLSSNVTTQLTSLPIQQQGEIELVQHLNDNTGHRVKHVRPHRFECIAVFRWKSPTSFDNTVWAHDNNTALIYMYIHVMEML